VGLFPSRPGDEDEIPMLKLRKISLVDCEKQSYEALSYCWGDEEYPFPILCHDGLMWVTMNLYMALRRLQESNLPRFLWIDAICINQTDLEEKSWQVRQMGDIYRNAVRVLVYLGGEKHNSRLLENFIPQLLRTEELMKAAGVTKTAFAMSRSEKRQFGIPALWNVPAIRALGAIQHRDWFARVWVIQEFLLAKEVTVICGNWEIPWSSFEAAIKFADALHLTVVLPWTDSALGYCSRLMAGQNIWAEDPEPKPLDALLTLHYVARATNPRDHIYALLGLAVDGQDIEIDYSKSVEDVFIDVSKKVLRKSEHLILLNSAGRGSNESTENESSLLPSWVPGWRTELVTFPLIEYVATAESEVGKISFEDGKLVLTGFELDTVEAVSCPSPPYVYIPADKLRLYGEIIIIFVEWANFCEPYTGNVHASSTQHKVNIFWQLLIAEKADCSFDQQRAMVGNTEMAMKVVRLIQWALGPLNTPARRHFIEPISRLITLLDIGW
jgi:hypothetical protein